MLQVPSCSGASFLSTPEKQGPKKRSASVPHKTHEKPLKSSSHSIHAVQFDCAQLILATKQHFFASFSRESCLIKKIPASA